MPNLPSDNKVEVTQVITPYKRGEQKSISSLERIHYNNITSFSAKHKQITLYYFYLNVA